MNSKKQMRMLRWLAGGLGALLAVMGLAMGQQAAAAPVRQGEVDDWARVKAAGKLVVATSVDYAPFAYYTSDFKTDGFDIALMREVGKRMGVAVEFNDYAFDGLLSVLNLKQADVAIAALSITPERQQIVDFSAPYYAGEDAVLALGTSSARVGIVNDLAGKRIGVQNGTIYAGWLRDALVEKNLIAEGQLLRYAQISAAVRDLKAGRLDYVVTDLLPAEALVKSEGVKLVGQGLNRQRFGIAVRTGSNALREQINTALGQIRADGTFNRLTQQYLNVTGETVAPPAGALPEPPAVQLPVCVDGMSYVADLNLDDRNMTAPAVMARSQSFSKSWRIRNSGTCEWPANYVFGYQYGSTPLARMGGQDIRIGRTVKPGETVDISVSMVAPNVYGTYQGFWSMKTAAGAAFGEMVWVGIAVPAPATATPIPQGASITFSVNRTQINPGETVLFSWNVQNVNGVYFYVQGDAFWNQRGVNGVDNRAVSLGQTTVYELRVEKRDGSVEVRQIRVDVGQVVGAPVIDWLNANTTQIAAGQCVVVDWHTQGQVDRMSLFVNGNLIYDYAPVNGNYTWCSPGAGTYTFEMVSRGRGGETRRQLTVYAGVQPGPTAAP